MKFINKRILIILSSYLCSHQSHTAKNKSYLPAQLPARRTNTHFFAHTDFIIPSIYANVCIYRPGGQLWKVWELVDLLRKHLFSGPWLSGVWPPILSPREKKKKTDKHMCVFPRHVFKCRRNPDQHVRRVNERN